MENLNKNLIFITSYRQVEEYSFYASFLKRTQFLKEFDIICYVNNIDVDIFRIKELFKTFPNKNKHLILTDINQDPWGPFQGLSNFYDLFSKYENVIHTHTDNFPVNEEKICNILQSNKDKTFLVNYSLPNQKDWMSTDLFVFRPHLLKENIFKNWVNYVGLPMASLDIRERPLPCCYTFTCKHIAPWAEQYLYWQVINHNISHAFIDRFKDNDCRSRPQCDWGFWHEHNLANVQQFLA